MAIRRREVLRLFAGAAAVPVLSSYRALAAPRRVGVIGGGIVGASISYHLARRGAEVTVFEKTGPAAGATQNSFAWINATYSKRPYSYYQLNRLGALGYRHLDSELDGALDVKWGGSLQWFETPREARRLREQVASHQAWGYPSQLIDAERFGKLEKEVDPGSVLAASYTRQEGSLDPTAATKALWAAAKQQGVRFESPSEVEGIDLKWGGVRGVRTTTGSFELDVLVVAAGVDTPKLAEMVGLAVPLIESPGILAHSKPLPPALGRVVLAPGPHMKQNPDGRLVTGVGFGGEPSVDQSDEHGEKILASTHRFVSAFKAAELERVTLGYRPLPKDGFPVVGFSAGAPDVYLAVMHSGVSMAPIMGPLVASEILDDARVALLDDFRLGRFTKRR